MKPGLLLYNIVVSLATPPAAAWAAVKGRLKGNWRERFGFIESTEETGRPLIWIHAVSVGEVQAAAALIKALRSLTREPVIRLSTTTDTGGEAARKLALPDCRVFTFPLDAFGSPGRAVRRLKPDLVIIMETELWPNFIKSARAFGARLMLANGRISERSVGRYRRARFLFKHVLDCLDLLAMIRPEDAERIRSLGARPERVRVLGNAKYDLLFDRLDPQKTRDLALTLGLDGHPVMVAGSTREGEEVQVLDAYQRLAREFPRLKLVLAPRHVQRAKEIESLARSRGLSVARRSGAGRPEPVPDVTLIDVMGDLFYLYGLAAVVFIGGSLAPLGGHNPLEAAVWGKPVLFGPHMSNFLDARDLLRHADACRTVSDSDELYQRARELLAAPDRAGAMGARGRRAVAEHQGASLRMAEMAMELLSLDKSG